MTVGPAVASVAGLAAGGAYFALGERGISKEDNCTYLSPAITDVLAWGAGAWMVWRSFQTGDSAVGFIGAAMAGLHLAQFGAHKALTRPSITVVDHAAP